MYALWGQDLTPLYGKTFNFSGDGAAKYPVTLPAEAAVPRRSGRKEFMEIAENGGNP
jgi:hypothetical protein